MKTIRVARLPAEINWPHRGAAVVIDVLRATSVITQAIASGADEVIVCGELDEAERLRRTQPRPLLCGERHCRIIPGFDLANSPSEFTADRVSGKRLVMTTTNGTRAAVAAADFDTLYAASFNNLSAVLRLLADEPAVTLLCAGSDGVVTDDDVLLAGALLHGLQGQAESAVDQQAQQSWLAHLASGRSLAERLRESLGAQGLLAAGFDRDIETCAQIDSLDVVAVASHRQPITFVRHSGS